MLICRPLAATFAEMEFSFTKILGVLLVPPGLMFGMMLLGLLLGWRYRRTGKTLFISSIALLLLASLPIVSDMLLRFAEDIPPLELTSLKSTPAQAIVVLGGGRYNNAPEYHRDTVGYMSLVRLRYAAQLHHASKLPLLTTGGSVYGEGESEATLMQQVLESELSARVKWIETASRTTQENAVLSKTLLANENITTIILVTHALHMRRAQTAFEKAGFTVIPAPLGYHTPSDEPLSLKVLPSATALKSTHEMVHEYWGRLWYWIRY